MTFPSLTEILNVAPFRYPSDEELHLIVKNQLSTVFNRFKKHLGKVYIDQVVDILIQMYAQVSACLDSCSL